MSIIDSFRNENNFLSNFFPAGFKIRGYKYKSSEHYYQCEKTLDEAYRELIRNAETPAEAAKLGRSKDCPLREDWDSYKFYAMDVALHAKFGQNEDLRKKLFRTGNAILIEGNTWSDRIWGKTKSTTGQWIGSNNLGRMLMILREEMSSYEVKKYWCCGECIDKIKFGQYAKVYVDNLNRDQCDFCGCAGEGGPYIDVYGYNVHESDWHDEHDDFKIDIIKVISIT